MKNLFNNHIFEQTNAWTCLHFSLDSKNEKNKLREYVHGNNISTSQRIMKFYTNSFVIDNTPWKTPEVPPKTGSNAKSNPTAQSFKEKKFTSLNIAFVGGIYCPYWKIKKKEWQSTCKIRVPIVTCPWRALVVFFSIKNFKTWTRKSEETEKLLSAWKFIRQCVHFKMEQNQIAYIIIPLLLKT